MLRPGQKTCCSVAKKFTVSRILSAQHEKINTTPRPHKNLAGWTVMIMLIFKPLVVEGVQHSEGEKVERQQLPRDAWDFFVRCSPRL